MNTKGGWKRNFRIFHDFNRFVRNIYSHKFRGDFLIFCGTLKTLLLWLHRYKCKHRNTKISAEMNQKFVFNYIRVLSRRKNCLNWLSKVVFYDRFVLFLPVDHWNNRSIRILLHKTTRPHYDDYKFIIYNQIYDQLTEFSLWNQ